MSGRAHNRTHFFKYATRAAALAVIQSHAFRWSSPTLFNDPFDHQTGFVLEPDARERMTKALSEAIERIVYGDAIPPQRDSLFTTLLLRMRSIRDRFPREEFMAEVLNASGASATKMVENLDWLNDAIRTSLCNSRVFCVSEDHDNVVMWSHYAENHEGVVFKLRCIDELGNRLLAARKVSYALDFVKFPEPERYAKHLTGEELLDIPDLAWEIAYTKHEDWGYEKEWRVHMPLLDLSLGEGTSDFEEPPQIFESIYLGCRMKEADTERILAAAKDRLPDVPVLKAERSRDSFRLDFKQVGGPGV